MRSKRFWFSLLLVGWLAQGFPSCKFAHADDGVGPRPSISPADEDGDGWMAAEKKPPTLYFITMHGCPACEKMKPIVAELVKKGWNIKTLDVSQYHVDSCPCFIMVVDGQMTGHIVGATDAQHLIGLFPKEGAAKEEHEATAAVPPQPDWSECPPVHQPENGTVLADIDSHMPAGHQYRDNDLITWGHETTHGIASRLRHDSYRPRINAFYCLKDRAIFLQEPNVKLADVAERVPQAMRGRLFQNYLHDAAVGAGNYQGGGSWNNEPLYVLDEWTAYCNGAAVGLEYGPARLGARSFPADVSSVLEFTGYANALLATVAELDPQHPDRKRLEDFVAWQTVRSLAIADEAEQKFGSKFSAQRDLLAKQYNATAAVLQCSDGSCWQRTRWFAPRLFSPPIISTPPAPSSGKWTVKPVEKSPPGAPVPGPVNPNPLTPPATPTPTQPSPQLSAEIKARLDRVEADVSKLQLAAATPGPAGPAGPKGDKGDPGPAPDITAINSALDGVKAQLAASAKPIHVNVLDEHGVTRQSTSVAPGGILNLQLVPVHPSTASK